MAHSWPDEWRPPPSYLEHLKAGDEIWIVNGNENWLKRIVEIIPEADGSYTFKLEDALENL